MLKSNLFDYGDLFILVQEPIGQEADTAAIQADRNNKQVFLQFLLIV